jgi:Na+/proline symporter
MIDIIIFIVFLLFNLIIGIKHRGKKQSFKEYAIGNKNFSTATITATIVATWASGSMFFNGIEQTYSNGLYYLIPIIVGSTFSWLVTGYIIGPRMGSFLTHVSMADAMSSIYGKGVQVIAATSTILMNIGVIAVQFKVITKILCVLFNYQSPWVTIIAAAIIIIYSAFGGVKSVTFTDVIQFITFGTLLPALALVIWQHIPNHRQVIHTIMDNPNFSLKHVVRWNPQFMGILALLSYKLVPSLVPQVFQRMAMARDIGQIKRSIAYSAGLLLLIWLFIAWIAILLLTDNPNLNTSQVVGYMIEKYTYTGLKGFLGVGVIALAMSSADSALNSCAVLVTNDILLPLRITKQASVRIAAISTFIIGFFAILLTLSIQNILEILLFSANFYTPIIVIPMLLTIFGFRTSKRVIFIGIGAGFAITTFLLLYFKNINSFFPGILTNFAFLLGSHYLLKEKGGWAKQQTAIGLQEANQAYLPTWKERCAQLKYIKPLAYLEKNLPDKEYYYPLLAFYLLTATYVSLYNLPHAIEQQYLVIYRIIQYSILVIATSLLGFPIWPAPLKNKRLLAWVWPLVIFYTLFFVGAMVMIMSHFQSDQVLIFMLNLVITVLLIYWPLALTLAVTGLMTAALVFKWAMGEIIFSSQVTPISFQFSYGLLLFSSLLIALSRFRQQKQTLQNKNTYLTTIYEEKNKEFADILAYREQLLKELSQEQIDLLDKTATAYMQQALYRITDYMRLEVTQINIAQLLIDIKELIKLKDLSTLPEIIIQKNIKEEFIYADVIKVRQLLVDSIAYIHKHGPSSKPILIAIEDAMLGHSVEHMKDYTRKLKAIKITITTQKLLSDTTNRVYMFDQAPSISRIAGDGDRKALLNNARIIDAHYGYAEMDKEDTHVYVLPVNVREVRGKVMELLREPARVDEEELKHPMAIELEKELMDKVKINKIDVKVIEKALDTIKKYHAGVKRKSGEPFFTHPIAVALILLSYCQDQSAVVAALLHDTVEDTSLSMLQIKTMFGDTVAFIVGKVTNLEDKLRRLSLNDHENIHRLINYEDERAAFVKLADRMHNMRTISGHSSLAKQKHIASETLNFFVPLAKNLGLEGVSQELERLSLEVLSEK